MVSLSLSIGASFRVSAFVRESNLYKEKHSALCSLHQGIELTALSDIVYIMRGIWFVWSVNSSLPTLSFHDTDSHYFRIKEYVYVFCKIQKSYEIGKYFVK